MGLEMNYANLVDLNGSREKLYLVDLYQSEYELHKTDRLKWVWRWVFSGSGDGSGDELYKPDKLQNGSGDELHKTDRLQWVWR